jgi:hypothetical protein
MKIVAVMKADVSRDSGLLLNKVIAQIRTPSITSRSQVFLSIEDHIVAT